MAVSAAALTIIVGSAGAAPASPLGAQSDRDCSDFATQAAAQSFFDQHSPSSDPHGLDSNSDGVACETLPCPCSTGQGGGSQGGNGPTQKARVTEVTDGDTIAVTVKGRERDIRLIGIDTPEVFGQLECGARRASASMHHLLQPGDRVELIRDPSQGGRDRYGRLLRYVERANRDVGRAQVRRGWANVYVYADPFQRLSSYNDAEDSARSNDRGVWRRCDGDFHQPLKALDQRSGWWPT